MRTLFKNGTIIDGTGEKPWVGDVLIEDDRIADVGENIAAEADKVVDLTGLQICPGLIDAHSHNDFFYDREDAEKYFKPFIEQGITTQITGNCSFSPFGMDENTRSIQGTRQRKAVCESRPVDWPGLGSRRNRGL